MNTQTPLLHAWRSFWVLKKQRSEAAWARLLISTGIAIAMALILLSLAGLFTGNLTKLSWWSQGLPSCLFISLCISYTIHGLYRGIEMALPVAVIYRISAWRDWRASIFFGMVGILGSLLGGGIALSLLSLLFNVDVVGVVTPHFIGNFLLITVAITVANLLWWSLHARRQALKLQATESQLRLLQAQIEPHFLFNTLANVQSLMDHDTPRAKLMLEAFSEYLRTSLSQLRSADSTLGAELDMVKGYLLLLQIRMGERLQFVIDADVQARAAIVPPLLLQPLVENAIHHGLEPKVEGGQLHISASVNEGRLEICVNDDGLGLQAPLRAGRSGNGVALENIRARLKTRYADNASLSLHSLPVGTRVCLNIPYNAKP